MRGRLLLFFLFFLFSVSACGSVTGGGDDGGDGVTREPLTHSVQVEPEDAERAEAVGWQDGFVPGAELALRRELPDGGIVDPVTATTGADGTVDFSGLLPGIYRVSALRLLSPEEVSRTEGSHPTLRAFGGGAKLEMREGTTEFTLPVQTNRTGHLIVSELSTVDKPCCDRGGDPTWVGYIELYNNSGETIFLDGKLLGRALNWNWEAEQIGCSQIEPFSNDPAGLWTRLMARCPGSGASHPVAPGETVLIAHDAIDHSEVDPDYPDLSAANFEVPGDGGDPDNQRSPT